MRFSWSWKPVSWPTLRQKRSENRAFQSSEWSYFSRAREFPRGYWLQRCVADPAVPAAPAPEAVRATLHRARRAGARPPCRGEVQEDLPDHRRDGRQEGQLCTNFHRRLIPHHTSSTGRAYFYFRWIPDHTSSTGRAYFYCSWMSYRTSSGHCRAVTSIFSRRLLHKMMNSRQFSQLVLMSVKHPRLGHQPRYLAFILAEKT